MVSSNMMLGEIKARVLSHAYFLPQLLQFVHPAWKQ
jgi:hypothetical protein